MKKILIILLLFVSSAGFAQKDKTPHASDVKSMEKELKKFLKEKPIERVYVADTSGVTFFVPSDIKINILEAFILQLMSQKKYGLNETQGWFMGDMRMIILYKKDFLYFSSIGMDMDGRIFMSLGAFKSEFALKAPSIYGSPQGDYYEWDW